MKLLDFARMAGVNFHRCDSHWGGTWAYSTEPSTKFCGYRTRREALEGWAIETFGEQAAKALFQVLEDSKQEPTK